jgi:hypothetical protein
LSLRSDIERAVEKVMGKPAESRLARGASPRAEGSDKPQPSGQNSGKTSAPKSEAVDVSELDFESCMEQVWEQLISSLPSRGRSMTTVRVGGARLLMSSWEVTAFVSEDGPSAEDLRRAVVARAMVVAATEQAKASANTDNLIRVLPIARVEVSRLQERVEVAKQAKDTEAAVNLGISTKRLLSALDEAEKI